MTTRTFLVILLTFAALATTGCGFEEDQQGANLSFAGQPTAESDSNYQGVRPTTSAYVFTGESEPPDEPGVYAISQEYREEWLPVYARDTAQLVVHENGSAEIIWDREAGLKTSSPSDLPWCQDLPKPLASERRDPTPEDLDAGPVCRAMADAMILGPPSGPGPAGPSTDPTRSPANSLTNTPTPDVYATIEQRLRDAGVPPYPTVVGDPPAVAQFVRDLELQGITATVLNEDDGSLWPDGKVEHCLGAPRRSFELSTAGRLHIFLYDSVEEAAGAAADVPSDADCGPITWAYDVHYFLDGEMIMFVATEDLETYETLNGWLGPSFACGKGPPFNTGTCSHR